MATIWMKDSVYATHIASNQVRREASMRVLIGIALAAMATLAQPSLAAVPRAYACPPDLMKSLVPFGAGPAHLERAFCLPLPHTSFTKTPPMVSPDGRRFFVHQDARGLLEGRLDRLAPVSTRPYDPTFLRFALTSPTVFEWSDNSRTLWGADQAFARPSHFATGPLRPIRIDENGRVLNLPQLTNRAGGLDGLLWIGGKGLALAKFGTGGGYYRPERTDRDPTLAFVDASRGKILQALPLVRFGKLMTNKAFAHVAVQSAVGGITSDGRARVILRSGRGAWVLWTQGSRPQAMALGPNDLHSQLALSPGASRLLVQNGLQPWGMICEHNPKCPAPKPVTGTLATLHDLATGRRIWSIRKTVTQYSNYSTPAISPDGQLALMTIPVTDGYRVALISMRDGRTLQTFRPPWTSELSLSFSSDGHFGRISGNNVVVAYRISKF